MPVAAGMALAEREGRRRGRNGRFLGDGTLGQGVVYESLNLASLWGLPLLLVVEHNYYAQSTPTAWTWPATSWRAPALRDRDRGTSTTDVLEGARRRANVQHVRSTGTPFFLVLDTYRFSAHSKGDDDRDPEEIARGAAGPAAVSRLRRRAEREEIAARRRASRRRGGAGRVRRPRAAAEASAR